MGWAFQEDWGVTVSPGCGVRNGGHEIVMRGRAIHQGAHLCARESKQPGRDLQEKVWAGSTLTRIPVWQVGRQKLGTQTTERMTHRVQRCV